MTCSSDLYDAFRAALNAELAAGGCGLQIAAEMPDRAGAMILLDEHGITLGAIPDHADVSILAAFEQILRAVRGA